LEASAAAAAAPARRLSADAALGPWTNAPGGALGAGALGAGALPVAGPAGRGGARRVGVAPVPVDEVEECRKDFCVSGGTLGAEELLAGVPFGDSPPLMTGS